MKARSGAFIACDWGSTRLRLRLVDRATGTVRAEIIVPDGIGSIADRSDAAFQRLLAERMGRLEGIAQTRIAHLPVVISGMAVSSVGWHDLPYAPTPVSVRDTTGLSWSRVNPQPGWRDGPIYLISGVRDQAEDVMRGEETELLGLYGAVGQSPPPDATVILPGTHSKHARIADGRLVGFRTHLTGELFDILSRHSVLRHSVASASAPADEHFLNGVDDARRSGLSAALFKVRTRHVLGGESPESNRQFLSGVLIGAEIASLEAAAAPIVLAASAGLHEPYARAVARLHPRSELLCIPPERVDTLSASGQQVFLDAMEAAES